MYVLMRRYRNKIGKITNIEQKNKSNSEVIRYKLKRDHEKDIEKIIANKNKNNEKISS